MLVFGLCFCTCTLLGNGFLKQYRGNECTRNSRIIVGCRFYSVRVLSQENLWVWPYISLSLLGNGSVKALPRHRGIVGDIVFYVVRVVLEESRRFVLPRTNYNFTCYSVFVKINKIEFILRVEGGLYYTCIYSNRSSNICLRIVECLA
jgi:hypothetical protein